MKGYGFVGGCGWDAGQCVGRGGEIVGGLWRDCSGGVGPLSLKGHSFPTHYMDFPHHRVSAPPCRVSACPCRAHYLSPQQKPVPPVQCSPDWFRAGAACATHSGSSLACHGAAQSHVASGSTGASGTVS